MRPTNAAPGGRRGRLGEWLRANRVALTVVGVLLLAAVLLVGRSLRRPSVAEYVPSPVLPADGSRDGGSGRSGAAARGSGPDTVTVDASGGSAWVRFSFSRGSVVPDPGALDWDLAFRRFHVIANAGPGFAGRGGILDLGDVAFDEVEAVPSEGYVANEVRGDTTNPAIQRWYDYGWTSHLLRPKPRVYAVRTARGGFAKLELLSYYCPGARPGCVTFRYQRLREETS